MIKHYVKETDEAIKIDLVLQIKNYATELVKTWRKYWRESLS